MPIAIRTSSLIPSPETPRLKIWENGWRGGALTRPAHVPRPKKEPPRGVSMPRDPKGFVGVLRSESIPANRAHDDDGGMLGAKHWAEGARREGRWCGRSGQPLFG